ncbi:N-succinyl-LL-diaminopimelate desuccinylase [Patulibacter medicamentivorans]|uniref:Succinyl-diaminopimelate desuccinylase n=1 Tax=Patulibacter medicamentivorans TaxID=1097667 RepID=H0E2T1_9ACTN|nr:succinyl-diaminopimelate desuccinylase [Patulibacter medicamentivorans]EHN12009.1 N-succinyl-LL-diaminopimelate desuccinylase [Patulibacter medicamentivorans]
MTSLADRLAASTLQLVDCPSESRHEEPAIALAQALLFEAGVETHDAHDTCLTAGTTVRGERPLILLAGHLDTVPEQGNRPGRIADGVVHGLGACDMKGACAVMLELLRDGVHQRPDRACDLGVVLFGREELPFRETALTPLLEREPALRDADLVVVMEPTANGVQGGCLGNLNATWSFHGTAAHSARPWLGSNAIHRAAAGIAHLAQVPVHRHEFHGLTYAECVSVTRIAGGVADNVVPDRAEAHVNYRYPPGIPPEAAESQLRAWCSATDSELTIVGNAPSGAVTIDGPLAQALIARSGRDVTPKQAWTPVAEFGLAGTPAINYGPGDPAFAHKRDEQVAVAALVESYETLAALVATGS